MALAAWLAFGAQAAAAVEKILICHGAASSALVPLAKLRDFYAAEGLDVELRLFPSGKQALDAMFAGECALSAVAETPVAHQSLRRDDFLILAEIALYDNFERIIVRNDRGIGTAADLRGRRVATAEFTTAHYFLDIFLIANGLTPKDVTKVYLPAQEVAPAFRRGDVDAAAHWEPNIQNLVAEFGAKAKVFAAPGLHVSPFLLVGGRDFVHKNPAMVERVLRALTHAERYAKEQPANFRVLMARYFKVAPSEIDLIWPLHDFRVSLDQSLPFILENAARWEIGLLPAARRPAMPNFLDLIYFDGLTAVKPAAVTLIH
jgi:NitT/TauT family transport system substrate-binding protein